MVATLGEPVLPEGVALPRRQGGLRPAAKLGRVVPGEALHRQAGRLRRLAAQSEAGVSRSLGHSS
jgi:hypothetical protein